MKRILHRIVVSLFLLLGVAGLPKAAEAQLSGTDVQLRFRETDQTVSAGYWRFRLNGGNFSLDQNTAVAGDYTTTFTPVFISSTGVLLKATDGSFSAPSYTFAAEPGLGWFRLSSHFIGLGINGGTPLAISNTQVALDTGINLNWASDTYLWRDGANTLALKNTNFGGNNHQTFRVYGSTANSSHIFLTHDASDGTLGTSIGNLNLTPTTSITNVINGSTQQSFRVNGAYFLGGTNYLDLQGNNAGGTVTITNSLDQPLRLLTNNSGGGWTVGTSAQGYRLTGPGHDIGTSGGPVGNIYGNAITVTPSTPADNDACFAGTFYADASFIYVCTAPGTIKRAALSSF